MKRIFVTLVAVIAWSTLPSFAQTFTFTDKGAGMYTDTSVASQASTFTLNPNQVSCGVGTVDANGAFGPFEMEMASYTVDSYSINRSNGTITATGHMRSQTRIAGVIIEDTNGVGNNPPPHAYVAIGKDGRGGHQECWDSRILPTTLTRISRPRFGTQAIRCVPRPQ